MQIPFHSAGTQAQTGPWQHMAASLLALIDGWLAQPQPAPAVEMAAVYERLIISATLQARG